MVLEDRDWLAVMTLSTLLLNHLLHPENNFLLDYGSTKSFPIAAGDIFFVTVRSGTDEAVDATDAVGSACDIRSD